PRGSWAAGGAQGFRADPEAAGCTLARDRWSSDAGRESARSAHRRNPSPCSTHDLEKWEPVFQQDHATTKNYSAAAAVSSGPTGVAGPWTAGALVKRRDRRATVAFRSCRCTTAST